MAVAIDDQMENYNHMTESIDFQDFHQLRLVRALSLGPGDKTLNRVNIYKDRVKTDKDQCIFH